MPPLPDANKVVKVSVTMTLMEDLGAKCNFFKRYSGTAPTDAQLTTFCGDISTLLDTANLDQLMSAAYSFVGVDAIDLSSSTAAVGSDASVVDGTRSGDVLPADACVVVSHRIARRYRGGHPRNYWPFGVSDDLQDAQTWTSAFLGQVDSNIDTFMGAINSAGWSGAGTIDSVNVSYYEGFTVFIGPTGRARNISTPRSSPVIDTVTAHSPRTGIGSQRGRLLHLA